MGLLVNTSQSKGFFHNLRILKNFCSRNTGHDFSVLYTLGPLDVSKSHKQCRPKTSRDIVKV